MSASFEEAMQRLQEQAGQGHTPEELQEISQGILNLAKHDGKLGGRNPYSVCCVIGKRTHYAGVRIGHDEVTSTEIWLSPAQALSLLAWLEQEEDELQRLAKEQQS